MEDRSSSVTGGLTGGSSMAGTNTISTAPPYQPPGSESESSAGVTAGTPGPSIPAAGDHRVLEHGSDGGASNGSWSYVKGVGHG